MSKQQMTTIFRAFQKASATSSLRRDYYALFEKRMVYRTTKSENPEVTPKMVEKVFHKLNS